MAIISVFPYLLTQEWSLADDAALLEFLKHFSTEMLMKARETTIDVNSLVHDTKMTDVKLRNVTDRFLVLSDSQFIENRVYDEDPNEKSKDKTEKTENGVKEPSSNPETDLYNKLSDAIKSGLQVLDNAFDVLDVNAANSDFDSDLDSEEEEKSNERSPSHTQAIYEPKDPYVSRPLPHLIGSRGFHEDPSIGIADLLSEDEVQDEDQGSISESDEEVEEKKVKVESESDSSDYDSDDDSSDEGENVKASRKNTSDSHAFSGSSSDENRGLFADKHSDGSGSDEDMNDVPRKSSNASKINKRKSTAKKVSKSEKSMFEAEEDDNDLFAGSGGLFGTGKNLFQQKKTGGLFDEVEDSEEDLSDFSENTEDKNLELESEDIDEEEKENDKKEEQKKSMSPNKKYGGVSVFGDAISKDFFGKKKHTEDQEEVLSHTSSGSTKKKVDLFDESDDDLFSDKKKVMKKTKAASITSEKKTEQKSKTSLFDSSSSEDNDEQISTHKVTKKVPEKPKVDDLFGSDSEDEMFMENESSQKKSSKPFGGVSMFGKGGEALVKSLTRRNESIEEPKVPDNEADIDSDSDSMFAEKPPPLEKSSEPKTKLGGLFDEDSDDADDFFSPAPKKNIPKTTKASLFSDSDEDDFFSTAMKSKVISNKDEEDPPPKSSVTPHEFEPIGKTEKEKDLFKSSSEESEGDEKPVKRKPVGAVPMFLGTVGGAELVAAISKRRSDTIKSVTEESEDNVVVPVIEASTVSVKQFEKPVMNVTAKGFKPLSDVKMQAPRTSPNFLKDLNTKLGIDSTSQKKKTAPLPVEISFDKPSTFKTLESMNKTRARGQANRRPPSRYRKSAAPSQTSLVETTVVKKVTKSINIKEDSGDAVLAKTNDDIDSKVDTLQPTDVDDVIEATLPKPYVVKTDDFEELDKELFSGSLFEKSTQSRGKSSKVVSHKLFDNDFFGNDDILDFEIDHTKKETKPTESQADELFADFDVGKNVKKNTEISYSNDEEDIFSFEKDLSLPSESKVKQKDTADSGEKTSGEKKKRVVSIDDIFGGDDDDIFGEGSIPATKSLKQPHTKKPEVKKGGLFNDEDDEDKDIFTTKTKPPAGAQAKTASKSKKESIFGDEDIGMTL